MERRVHLSLTSQEGLVHALEPVSLVKVEYLLRYVLFHLSNNYGFSHKHNQLTLGVLGFWGAIRN